MEFTLTTIILFGIVVLCTHFLEGITGFGCTVLALPFCILLVGTKVAVPILTILAWILAIYVIIIDYKNIVKKEFLRILLYVGLGFPIGMYLFDHLPEHQLKMFLAVFMILVSIRGLALSFSKNSKSLNINKYLLNIVLFLGGIIHGAFSSGGPFVVIYATKALPKKSNFRATLCALWATLNTITIAKYFIKGNVFSTPGFTKLLLGVIPFLFVGMLLGNKAHNKVDETLFTKMVYGVLLVSGSIMLL
jgi:uncharacterized membrane protein YfcA